MFNMLILSDLHYDVEKKESFEQIFKPFLKTLSSFINNNKEWIPNCLALVGDIVHCKNSSDMYEDIRLYIDMIKDSIGTSFDVVAVPGNHDKQLYLNDSIEAINDATQFLSEFTKSDSSCCSISKNYLNKYFSNYANFISKYYNSDNWIPVPRIDIDQKLLCVSGCYICDKSKICIVALNTEWLYVRKQESKQESKHLDLTLDSEIIKEIEKTVRSLKRRAYSIITLMHRSPYRLSWNDIYGLLGENSNVERIVEISDLIICGHEHNTKNREPDMLMNSTLLLQNGCMFDLNSVNYRYPYSASLIKFDNLTRLIYLKKIRFNMADPLSYEWTLEDDIKIYSLESIKIPREKKDFHLKNEIFKEITCSYPLNIEILHRKILSLFYDGPNKENIPSYINCNIIPLQETTIENWMDKYINAESKKFKINVFLIYAERFENKDFDINTQQAILLYRQVRSQIREKNLAHMVVTNLIFCNVL